MSISDPARAHRHPGRHGLPDGVNFSVFCQGMHRRRTPAVRRCRRCHSRPGPSRSIPTHNRTYHYWHVFVPGHQARDSSTAIGLDGPRRPGRGCASTRASCSSTPTAGRWRFPTGTAAGGRRRRATTAPRAMKSVVADPRGYDWEGDAPLQTALSRRRSSMRCTWAASPATPIRAFRRKARHLCRADRKDPLPARTWGSPPWNSCRSSSSTRRTPRQG